MTRPGEQFQPKRGRPSAKQVAAIDQAILSTARRLFLDQGFDIVAMEGIATAAGVSKSTLYARYPSKSVLFTAIIESSVREWSEISAQRERLLSDDIGERLQHYARTIAGSLSLPDVKAFQRTLLASRDRFPELSRTMYDVGYRYIVRQITRDIQAAAERDGIAARDPASIGELLVSAITGWQMQEMGHHDLSYAEIERFAVRTVDLLLAARTSW
jgi:AcrR family transcriptional regulator